MKNETELKEIASICRKVPRNPAQTLHEAFNSAWIFLIGVLMENNNVALSPGRFDQYFQPYFENDMKKITGKPKKKSTLRKPLNWPDASS
jgi:formate C-acetyltransferase